MQNVDVGNVGNVGINEGYISKEFIGKENFTKLNEEAGKYIRKLRLENGLTGSDLAKIIGVSQQQVSRYERGENNLSIADFAFILSVFDVNFLDFVIFSSLINIK